MESGLPARARTWDPLIKSQLLYQLSYGEFPGGKNTNFLSNWKMYGEFKDMIPLQVDGRTSGQMIQ